MSSWPAAIFAGLCFPLSKVATDRRLGRAAVTALVGAVFLELLPASVFATNPAGVGAESAAAAMKSFKVAEGLEVRLFASEPMVRNPTDMDIDERGRVWVAEGANYRSSFKPWGVLDPAGDRIVILEDTKGDGRADKQTVFYQDPSINSALGVCVLGNRVIVSDSPNVFVLTDTDGDGRADKRELLFTGIGGFDHDHGVHAFVFGPDGKLYFNMGNEGKRLRIPLSRELPLHGLVKNVASRPAMDIDGEEISEQSKTHQMGMVFRCNLDGSELETLAWNFRNNYEVAVDSFGTLWQSDNDDDGNRGVRINYVMEHGNFGYKDEMTGAAWPEDWNKARLRGESEEMKVFYEWHQFDPGVVPNLLHTGAGSPTGIAVYEGKLLPQNYRNQVIHCDALPRVVRSYTVQPAGAGCSAYVTDILTTDDSWFRPSDVCVAPDGSVFVADWNDANVGGHNMADQSLDQMTGRIYRIAPAGNKPSYPKWKLKAASGFMAAFQSPNLSARYLGWTRLHAMQGKAAGELQKAWGGEDQRIRARALQLLARIDGQGQRWVEEAVRDANPDIRITGLRIAREIKLDPIPLVRNLIDDASPQVWRECALSLRHSPSPEAAILWAKLALVYDGRDRWYLEALGIGADGQWDRWLDSWLKLARNDWNSPAGREVVWRSRSSKTAGLLVKIIQDSRLTEEQRQHYFRSFDFISGPEKQAALLGFLKNADLDSGTIAIEVLSRLQGVEGDSDMMPGVRKALQHVRGKPQFVEIVRDFRIKDEDQALLEFALKDPAGSTGVEAARLLMRHGQKRLIMEQLGGSNAVSMALVLGNTSESAITPLLEPILLDRSRDLAVRKQACKSLVQAQSGAARVVELARDNRLPLDVRLVAATELSNVRWRLIKARAAEVLPVPQSADSKPLPPISELVKQQGYAARGADVFRRDSVGCIKCHQVNGEGTDFGPNLSEIGTKLGKDALYESILDPSAGISFGYEAWLLTLKNGDDISGLIVSETAGELVFKISGGIVTRYSKSEITGRTQQKLSIMPANLAQTMSAQDLVDLIEYLSMLNTGGRQTATNRGGQ